MPEHHWLAIEAHQNTPIGMSFGENGVTHFRLPRYNLARRPIRFGLYRHTPYFYFTTPFHTTSLINLSLILLAYE